MKRSTKSLLAAVGVSIMAASPAWSYPVQYNLEGSVIQTPGINDSAGFLADLGITVGSAVFYSIIIDLDAKGTVVGSDGTVTERVDPLGRDLFYVHYVSGSTITPQNYICSYQGIAENNYGGSDWSSSTSTERWIAASNGNNYLTMLDMLGQPDSYGEWPTGGGFGAAAFSNTIYDASGNCSTFYISAHIASKEVVPVPEPSSLVFLAVGCAGLLVYRKRDGREFAPLP